MPNTTVPFSLASSWSAFYQSGLLLKTFIWNIWGDVRVVNALIPIMWAKVLFQSHTWQLIVVCNSRSRKFNVLFWLLWAQDLLVFIDIHAAKNGVQIKKSRRKKITIGISGNIYAWSLPVWDRALLARYKTMVLFEGSISPMLQVHLLTYCDKLWWFE